jgi:hypothetical protein
MRKLSVIRRCQRSAPGDFKNRQDIRRGKPPGEAGDTMKNNAKTYFMLVAVIIAGLVMVGNRFIGPGKNADHSGVVREGIVKPLTIVPSPVDQPETAKSLDLFLIGTFVAALGIGCLAGIFFRRRPQRGHGSLPPSNDLLLAISSATGINEYELFRKAAHRWGVSGGRIDSDFRHYMATHRLPYYVTDYARKNRFQTDDAMPSKKEEPSSWMDWLKALLVFPGSFVFLYVSLILLP